MIIAIVLGIIGAWVLVSVLLALVIGRAIKLADNDHKRRVSYRSSATPTAHRARLAS